MQNNNNNEKKRRKKSWAHPISMSSLDENRRRMESITADGMGVQLENQGLCQSMTSGYLEIIDRGNRGFREDPVMDGFGSGRLLGRHLLLPAAAPLLLLGFLLLVAVVIITSSITIKHHFSFFFFL